MTTTGLKIEKTPRNALFEYLKGYFPNNPDLMTSLKEGAIWEYVIKAPNLDDPDSKTILTFYLVKNNDNTLEMIEGNAPTRPDLILYFTEKAITTLIHDSPSAEKYYEAYRYIMNNPTDELDIDYKVNKPRLKLWRIGYRTWSIKLYYFYSNLLF
ncbi:MAG: hypothetical protein ACTSQQ_17555 [Candidatus Helarchaeota archaeon]